MANPIRMAGSKIRVWHFMAYPFKKRVSESLEPNSNYFIILKYQHLYSKAYAMFLSGYNIKYKAVFVPGSYEQFPTIHFSRLSKFHSDIIFLHLYFLNTFQCSRYWPLEFAFFLPKSSCKQLVVECHFSTVQST